MSEISTENIFHIRKGLSLTKMTIQEQSDLWFKQLLPAINLQELVKESIEFDKRRINAGFGYKVDSSYKTLQSLVKESEK